MLVKIERLPETKPYSRVKSFCVHPHFPLIAISLCEVKYFIRLHPFHLAEKKEQSLEAFEQASVSDSFFKLEPAVFQKRCEMTKRLQWSAGGFLLFQITSKGVKVLALSSKSSLGKKEYAVANSDYIEDSSEIIAFASSAHDTHIYYATLRSKLVKYSLAQRTRTMKELGSKTLSICADPLDKFLVLLSLGHFSGNFKIILWLEIHCALNSYS